MSSQSSSSSSSSATPVAAVAVIVGDASDSHTTNSHLTELQQSVLTKMKRCRSGKPRSNVPMPSESAITRELPEAAALPAHCRKTYYGKINLACVSCRKAHRSCDGGRPCSRCVSLGIADQCISLHRKVAHLPRQGFEAYQSDPFLKQQLQAEQAAADEAAARPSSSPVDTEEAAEPETATTEEVIEPPAKRQKLVSSPAPASVSSPQAVAQQLPLQLLPSISQLVSMGAAAATAPTPAVRFASHPAANYAQPFGYATPLMQQPQYPFALPPTTRAALPPYFSSYPAAFAQPYYATPMYYNPCYKLC